MAVQGKERYVCDSKGRKKAVVLDMKSYNQLMEDMEDLRLIAERKSEPTVSLAEAEKRLKARGLL